jgi:hypothetical protein
MTKRVRKTQDDLDGELRSPAWKDLRRNDGWRVTGFVAFMALVYWVAVKLEDRHIDGPLVNVVLGLIILGSIGVGFWFDRRNQKRVVSRYQLACSHCGHVPTSRQIAVTEAMGECQKCYKTLRARVLKRRPAAAERGH